MSQTSDLGSRNLYCHGVQRHVDPVLSLTFCPDGFGDIVCNCRHSGSCLLADPGTCPGSPVRRTDWLRSHLQFLRPQQTVLQPVR
jgi:hypothetical protein